MHGDNPGIRSEHNSADILGLLFINYPIIPEGEKMVKEKYQSSKKQASRIKRLPGFEKVKKKNGINKVEESVVKSKEKGGKDFSLESRQYGMSVNLKIFSREIF